MNSFCISRGPVVFIIAAFIGMILLSHGEAMAQDSKPYVLSVVPQMPPVEMYARWSPFVERLARETGFRFRLKVYEKMSDFEKDIRNGAPDFIFPNPVQMVMARQSQGYVPLVRSSRRIAGVLFVRGDSAIKTVRDLAGKDVAFVGTKNL